LTFFQQYSSNPHFFFAEWGIFLTSFQKPIIILKIAVQIKYKGLKLRHALSVSTIFIRLATYSRAYSHSPV
jgi:hypothetical protein